MSAVETPEHPAPELPTPEAVAELLVAESALDMLDADGTPLEIWTISCDGAEVRASGPRLEMHEGMQLRATLTIEELPYDVSVRVKEAGYRSESRASVRLLVTAVEPSGARRHDRRAQLSAAGTLRAVSCDRLLDGHELRVTVTDLSTTGIGLMADDIRLRAGDLLAVHCRFFEGTLDTWVRVSTVTQVRPGELRVGCRLTQVDLPTQDLLERVLDRLCGDAAGA